MDVLVVDDHEVVRRGLCEILNGGYPECTTHEASTAEEALTLSGTLSPHVIILDVSLPDRNGIELLKDIVRLHPACRVLVLSVHPPEQLAVRALRDGAMGYLSKSSAATELIHAVKTIAEGGHYISSDVADQMTALLSSPDLAAPHDKLSDREYEVLIGIASGRSVSEIADDLNLSVKTISTYRARVLEKMSLGTNSQLTRYAFEHDLIDSA